MNLKTELGIDQIYIISLPHRTDRRISASDQIRKYDIPATFWLATKNDNGAEGLYQTMMEIFEVSVKNNWQKIMILEDDFIFLTDPLPGLTRSMSEFPDSFDMLYLGCNIPHPIYAEQYSNYLIRVRRALSTHAVIYSNKAMKKILELDKQLPIDLMLAHTIHKQGESFCTYPLLCVQSPGYSDIEHRTTDYKSFIEERYSKAVKDLFAGSNQ